MSGYLTNEQVAQLLRPINSKRVSTDGKGFSHVEAYDIRAHLNRVFGFARWSADLLDFQEVFVAENNGKWTVCYTATVRLTVCAPDGTTLATYTEVATGEAKNQPHRGDAHDLAVKTAESQALKRCAVNLGDNFGLSLYARGSTAALVKATLVTPTEPARPEAAVDSHITEQLPAEDAAADPEPDPRQTNAMRPPYDADDAADQAAMAEADEVAAQHAAQRPVVSVPTPEDQAAQRANELRQQAIDGPPDTWTDSPQRWINHLMIEAVKAKVQNHPVESLTSTTKIALRVLLEAQLKKVTADARATA